MADVEQPEDRWKTILQIWDDNRWLFGLAGVAIGVVIGLLLGLGIKVVSATQVVQAFFDGIWPEVISTSFAIFVIDQLNRRRGERNRIRDLQDQLVAEAGSNVNDVALHAINQLRKQSWLKGDNGLLQGKDLSRANLQGADLSEANLQKTFLYAADLRGASLWEANLKEADLRYAKLKGAHLEASNIQGANLCEADLREANLQEADLEGADLSNSNLQNSHLLEANLQGANMHQANLEGADLRLGLGEKLEYLDEIIQFFMFSEGTILPDAQFKTNLSSIFLDKHWAPDTDMSRYTDPNHPDFWQPDWVKDAHP